MAARGARARLSCTGSCQYPLPNPAPRSTSTRNGTRSYCSWCAQSPFSARGACRPQKPADRQPSCVTSSLLHLVDRLQPIHGCQQPDSTLVRSAAAASALAYGGGGHLSSPAVSSVTSAEVRRSTAQSRRWLTTAPGGPPATDSRVPAAGQYACAVDSSRPAATDRPRSATTSGRAGGAWRGERAADPEPGGAAGTLLHLVDRLQPLHG